MSSSCSRRAVKQQLLSVERTWEAVVACKPAIWQLKCAAVCGIIPDITCLAAGRCYDSAGDCAGG